MPPNNNNQAREILCTDTALVFKRYEGPTCEGPTIDEDERTFPLTTSCGTPSNDLVRYHDPLLTTISCANGAATVSLCGKDDINRKFIFISRPL